MAIAGSGRWVTVQATARVRVRTGGTVTAMPIPESHTATGTARSTPLITSTAALLTASENNAGTIYFCPGRPGTSTATVRRTTMIPLTAGKSLSITGTAIGKNGPRDYVFGTGYSYITASATPYVAILTYETQV